MVSERPGKEGKVARALVLWEDRWEVEEGKATDTEGEGFTALIPLNERTVAVLSKHLGVSPESIWAVGDRGIVQVRIKGYPPFLDELEEEDFLVGPE